MISLDSPDSLWIIVTLAFLLGGAFGCIVTWLVSGRQGRTRQLQLELEELKERFSEYRDQVTRHFMRTSDLVQEMTQSYRAVYEHLASGAQSLCADIDTRAKISAAGAERIGAPGENMVSDSPDAEYDELTELRNIRKDIDELLGESPRISDLDIKTKQEDGKLRH